MTSRFLAMFPYLFNVEGRELDTDPDDPGNWSKGKLVGTKYGIDAASHPGVDIRNITEDEAKEIYWNEYWEKNHCEDLDYPLGEAYFDTCVNAGRGRADQLLTITRDPAKYIDAKDAFYRRLAERRPKSKKYLKGWLNRNNALRRQLGIKVNS